MDSTTEKSCLEEISTLVLDANEKVTLKTISNNWLVSYTGALTLLSKWLDQNRAKVKNLEIGYLVRGYNKNDVFCISNASENRKSVLEKSWRDFRSQLYSVDLTSNTRKLDLPDYEPIKVKKILLSLREPRNLNVPVIPIIKEEQAVKKVETAKVKTPFNVIKPSAKADVKKETKVEKPVTVELEKKLETIVISDDHAKDVKSEKHSPEDKKNSKGPAAKKIQLKSQKPVQKGSISSFFNNKPGTSKGVTKKPKESPVELKEKPEAVIDVEQSNSRKRSTPDAPAHIVEEVEKEKKSAAKKIKLKKLAGSNKRSRIRIMQDSSDDEEAADEAEEPESKLIKFDREFTPDEVTSPVKTKESPEKKVQAGLNKHKSKRWVTKRFETEDGFVRTERVQEEYSASEGENDENRKKNSPPAKKVPVERKSAEKQRTTKPKPAAAGKAKQGSITSFFNKK